MSEQYTVEQFFGQTLKKENARFSLTDQLIMLAFDDNYVDQSINLMLSIEKYHPYGVSFICASPNLKPENVEAILALKIGVQLNCYDYTPITDPGKWSPCTLYRLFAPWLFDSSIRKILYLDSDMICTGNFQELLDLEVPVMAMCSEISGNVSNTQEKTVRNLLPARLYCNAGVSLFNLDYLREHHTFHEIFTELNNMRQYIVFPDQDFLNVYFKDKITCLNPFYYNFQAYEVYGTKFFRRGLNRCKLIHFSVGKPWLYKSNPVYIRIYLEHSLYPPMIRRIQAVHRKSLLYSPIRIVRHWLSPLKKALSGKK